MNWSEILGFVTGAASVLLAVRESAWNWPVGVANNLFFLILFWRAKLYADSALQIVYIVISIFGWWNWVRGGAGRTELPIGKTVSRTAIQLIVLTVASAALLTLLLHRFTDSSAPLGDGVTTALSLIAQYMLSRKLLENWWVWMTADVIYVALYCYKSLYLTAVLYFVFFAMCIAGYARWRKSWASRASNAKLETAGL
jgi:nicotinamide mononucleotide transporter